jgi:hypothetical protein
MGGGGREALTCESEDVWLGQPVELHVDLGHAYVVELWA